MQRIMNMRIMACILSVVLLGSIPFNSRALFAQESVGIILRVSATPFLGKVGEQVLFSADGSQGEIISYEWTFSDGKVGRGQNYRRTFARAGTYRAILTVTDNQKRKATGMTVTVIRR